MSFDRSGLDSYNDVASRIAEFRAKHPDGSLQPVDPAHPFDVQTIGDKTFLVYVAAAYRTPDDPRPGIGVAWEPFPGRTPYTRDSEVMVLETSAWGRAIVAALAADTRRGIASADEVRNRQTDREPPPSPFARLNALFGRADIRTVEDRTAFANSVLGREITSANELTQSDIDQLVEALEQALAEPTHEETPGEA
jgi:hypothetical protein